MLICVGPGDLHGLFPLSLRLLLSHCPWVSTIRIVTPQPAKVQEILAQSPRTEGSRITLHADNEVAGPRAMALPGWFRQQYIKLWADAICATENFVCLGADALILEPVEPGDFLAGEEPLLRFFRYEKPARHLYFERTRVLNVAAQLELEPARSFLPGDFICDFFPMNRAHLQALRAHLDRLYGPDGLGSLLTRLGPVAPPDNRFGEWTMYAVFILDGLQAGTLRLAERDWARQVHSANDLLQPDRYAARIVHFAHEPGGTEAVTADLVASGKLRRELVDPLGSPI